MLTIEVAFTMWASIAVVIAAILLYMSGRLSMELVSASIITVLLLLFALPFARGVDGEAVPPEEILSGFGNGALITIMALLIIGQGLFQTGALDGPSRRIMRSYDTSPRLTLLGVFVVVFITSAFINNTPVVVMFLPIMGAIAVRASLAASKLLIPLSFVSVLAGMTTLIGSSTNLLAAETLTRMEGQSLGFFSQTPDRIDVGWRGSGLHSIRRSSSAAIARRRRCRNARRIRQTIHRAIGNHTQSPDERPIGCRGHV